MSDALGECLRSTRLDGALVEDDLSTEGTDLHRFRGEALFGSVEICEICGPPHFFDHPAPPTNSQYDTLLSVTPLVTRHSPRKSVVASVPQFPVQPREPALTAALMFASGIIVDRYSTTPMTTWIGWGVVTAVFAVLALRVGWRGTATVLVALLLVMAGGARHHQFWSLRETPSIAALPAGSQPVKLIATIASPISTRSNNRPGVPTWMRLDHSVLQVECESLVTHDEQLLPVVGLVRVDVAGHLLDLVPGDRVEILGQLAVPEPPRNPGDFDYPEFLRSRGMDRVLRCDTPDTVQLIERPRGLAARVSRLREGVRRECDRLMFDHLPPRLQPVAASLLIGDRSDLHEETETAFIRSGTMHILAISGLHIGVLASFVMLLCRAVQLRTLTTSLLVLAVIYGYAAIAESRPPVMRAVVLGTLIVIGRAFGRKSDGIQALALSALILLLLNPADLFDVGAQLSFVAVAAIIVVTRWVNERTQESFTDRLLAGEQHWIWRATAWSGRWLLAGYIVTCVVWLVTVPITMRTFHLVSPAGLVVNALLTPFSTLVLCAGYVFLGVGLLCPPLAEWVVIPFRESLKWFLNAVEWSAMLPGGYGESPSPSLAWMIGFYVLLLAGLLLRSKSARRWVWRGTCVWTLGWLVVAAWPRTPEPGLTCTFLDVGHGEAIVVECPNGRTLLYDIGSMGDGRRAARAVQALLRERGTSRVDALVISHADSDHYNGGIDLVSQTPVGTALFSQHCLDFEQEGVPELFEELAQRGTALRMIQAGDRLHLDTDVVIEVLHPTPAIEDAHDNANSVVLRITYAGRVLLLTGDLERSGSTHLQETPLEPVDLLLAPHHGGKSANTAAFAQWTRPRHVVASCANDITSALTRIYDRAETIHCTAATGAVRVHVAPDGVLSIQTHNSSTSPGVATPGR